MTIMTIEQVIAILAPHYCEVCGAPGNVLCPACADEIIEAQNFTCHLCNITTLGALFCGSCLAAKPFQNAWSIGKYNDVLKCIIQRYKFDYARNAAEPLSGLFHRCLPQFSPEMLVTYVPTAPGRIRERGFDHARLLAELFAHHRGLKVSEALVRTNSTRQVGSSRSERLRQAKMLFKPKNVKPLPYLLIDDVTTTGATIDAAAELLKGAGAKVVYVAVAANQP
jgi:ComF family protein